MAVDPSPLPSDLSPSGPGPAAATSSVGRRLLSGESSVIRLDSLDMWVWPVGTVMFPGPSTVTECDCDCGYESVSVSVRM